MLRQVFIGVNNNRVRKLRGFSTGKIFIKKYEPAADYFFKKKDR
jgi:hypothetical protein